MIGLIVGGIDALFGRVLIAITDFRGRYIQILIWFLPIAGLFICWMYHRFNEMSLKGMTLVLETAQGKRADIPLALVPLVMVGTWITHLLGKCRQGGSCSSDWSNIVSLVCTQI